MSKVHLHVMVDEDVGRQVRDLAIANGLSASAVVNMALRRGLSVLVATGLTVSQEDEGQ
jgi:hypothetical protein